MAKDIRPSRDISRLIEIMAALRTPDTGCPWDLAQNFRSIAPYTIEEAYEVADAIERGDLGDLKDELGDLLLQVVYHARMAEERAAFRFGDVVEAITSKMIRRHPHVFGTPEERTAGAAEGFWERIKAEEKSAGALRSSPSLGSVVARSLLAEVPVTLPALTRAVKLQDKAAKVGFDWPNIGQVFDKLREELAELELEIGPDLGQTPDNRTHSKSPPPDVKGLAPNRSKIEEEFGDVMLAMANLARHLKIDPEAALRGANQKFIRRFRYVEEGLARRGKSPEQSDLAEMDALWDEAKKAERSGG